MTDTNLMFGLLNTSRGIADPGVARRARELTIAFSRFKYFDAILEDVSVDVLLDRAVRRGAGACLVQTHGHILQEIWRPEAAGSGDLMAFLDGCGAAENVLVTGHVSHDGKQGYVLDRHCFLVNLRRYRALGCPSFGDADPVTGSAVLDLEPLMNGDYAIRQGPAAGELVRPFPPEIASGMVHLRPEEADRLPALRSLLAPAAIDCGEIAGPDLPDGPTRAFLHTLHTLIGSLQRGVFVWNLEGYEDVEQPPEDFAPPLRALYTVAAGFKPNRILETHGFDARTRMVVYDYSPQGLEFRRRLHETWDGEDYPGFLRRLFQALPSSEAHYILWDGATPETVDWRDMEQRWQQELEAWGGARALRDHWRRFKEIRVDYRLCNLLADPAPLLTEVRDEPSAVIWWSNAFFSMHSIWRHSADERRSIYRAWIEALADRAAPALPLRVGRRQH